EAVAFGLNAARQPDGFAQAAVQLSEYRKMHPGPVEEFLFYDPPAAGNASTAPWSGRRKTWTIRRCTTAAR
ncbi:MAG: hypothetical protein ACREPY_18695, partial [Rhodanobacteraceae bacterium]